MKAKTDAKKPRGRPPTHAILVDGQWQLTQQSFELAAQRLVRYRRRAQQRYQEVRDTTRQQHPELFKQPARPQQQQQQQQTLIAARSTGQSENLLIKEIDKQPHAASACSSSDRTSDCSLLRFARSTNQTGSPAVH